MSKRLLSFSFFGIFTFLLILSSAAGQVSAAGTSQTGPVDAEVPADAPLDFLIYMPVAGFNVNAPELRVASLQADQNPIDVGGDFSIQVTIENGGWLGAPGFAVDWGYFPLESTEPIQSGRWTVSGLPAGNSVLLQTTIPTTAPGPFSIRIDIDIAHEVQDPIQYNNTKSMELGVRGVIDVYDPAPSTSTWAYGTYLLHDDFNVPANTELTIRSGAVVKPDPGVAVQVDGVLELKGTPEAPLAFTSPNDTTLGYNVTHNSPQADPLPGDWEGIIVSDTGTLSLDQALIRYGTRPIHVMGGHHNRDKFGDGI